MKGLGASILFLLWTIQGTPVRAADEVDERVDPAITLQMEHGVSRFNVIVHLSTEVHPIGRIPAKGRAVPASRLQEHRESSLSHVAQVRLRCDEGDFALRRVFSLRPAYSARVSQRGLHELLSHPRVRRIEHLAVMKAHVVQGVGLVRADVAHASGWRGAGTAIAVVDTGIDPLHPALGGAPLPNSKVVYGLDTADGDADPSDCNGHGTAVASIAAGRPHFAGDESSFAGGVAPEAAIVAYKASRDAECGTFYLDDVVHAIDDAILHRDEFNIVAINLSFGGGAFAGLCDAQNLTWSLALKDAADAGIAVVASAGNEARKDGRLAVPGCLANAISVGAVYDADLVNGYSYCIDDDCVDSCTDTVPTRRDVTCYSNSSRYLSLVAPSEQLIAAADGGGKAEFGGTSGAAPYVTGAVAVLNEVFSGLDPIAARLLLETTGASVQDSGSGLVHPLVDLGAALSSGDVVIGAETSVVIPRGGGQVARSTAVFAKDGYVDDVRVTVRIAHGQPENLTLTLTSPDGTQVMVHGVGDAPVNVDGLFETYPVTAPSREPLTRFRDHPVRGEWHLDVADTGSTPSEGGSHSLLGWALEISILEAPHPVQHADYVVPVVAHAPGESGTFWRSDLRIFNRSLTDAAELRLALVPRGANGLKSFGLLSFAVDENTLVDFPDVVGRQYGEINMVGNIVIETDSRNLIFSSRTYNSGDEDGVFGQYIGMGNQEDSIALGEPGSVIIQLANTKAYRTNIGLSEVSGRPLTVAISLVDGSTGQSLGNRGEFTVLPFSNLQTRVFEALGAPDSANALALLEATTGEGRVVAYASVIDATTGDAIFIPAARPAVSSSFMIPVAAKATGLGDTNWVTDIRIFNPASETVAGVLQFRNRVPSAAEGPLEREVFFEPGLVLAGDDVLGLGFGLGDAVGSLRLAISGPPAPLVVTSRTYNQVSKGTYGQFVNGVVGGFSTEAPATLIHLDSNEDYRTNLGIVESDGGQVTVRFVLKDGSGVTLGSGSVDLGPFQLHQIDDVARAVGVQSAENYRIDLFLDAGDGRFSAYASVVNNATRADAILVPASPL